MLNKQLKDRSQFLEPTINCSPSSSQFEIKLGNSNMLGRIVIYFIAAFCFGWGSLATDLNVTDRVVCILSLLSPGTPPSFILSPLPLPSPLCWFVFSHVIQRPRNREAESWDAAEQIHSLFNAERHQDVQQSQATHVTHRPITNRSRDSGAEVRAIVLLSYVTLPFNVGRPFCLMDVSQWLHNFQPKRPKLCMHIPEQCL